MYFGLQAITDGAANTIMFGEIATVETKSLNRIQNQGINERDAKVQGRTNYSLALQADNRGINVSSVAKQLAEALPWNPTQLGQDWRTSWDCLMPFTGFATINAPQPSLVHADQ